MFAVRSNFKFLAGFNEFFFRGGGALYPTSPHLLHSYTTDPMLVICTLSLKVTKVYKIRCGWRHSGGGGLKPLPVAGGGGRTSPKKALPNAALFFLRSLLNSSLLQRIGIFNCLYSQTRIVYSPYCGCLVRRLMGLYRQKMIFFIICFYAIMHRTTIVQNKIISIICSCLFFVRLIFKGLV